MGDDRLDRAAECYERAVFAGDPDAVPAGLAALDAVEADLSLARGRLLHARFLADGRADPDELALFERAVALHRRQDDARGEAEALFWVGTFHQVVRGDGDAGLPALERAYALARQAGDKLTQSYAVRHLGFHAMGRGELDVAGTRLEESLRLRREVGFRPGVAAALLALAELALETGERDRAEALLAEAAAEAEGCGAHGTLRWIAEAREQL